MNEDIESLIEKEELRLATVGKRALAYTIDELLISALIIFAIFGRLKWTNPEELIAAVNSVVLGVILVKVIYQTIFVYLYGASLGKMLVKIRIVAVEELDKPNFSGSLMRSVVRIISESAFYLGFLWAFFDPAKQGWHDKAAKTIVIDIS